MTQGIRDTIILRLGQLQFANAELGAMNASLVQQRDEALEEVRRLREKYEPSGDQENSPTVVKLQS